MTRFFVSEGELGLNRTGLTGENLAHAKVLRLKAGEKLLLCDGAGMESLATVREVGANEILLDLEPPVPSASEAAVQVSVYMAFSKGDKLEHVIQTATELGAYEIVAFPSARCWQKIAASAAEQSGRGRIPEVVVCDSYAAALHRGAQADKALLFYENEQATTLKMALQSGTYRSVSLLTGPEGGLEEQEVAEARKMGFAVCTLGKRILRCETAPLCALSAVMYDAGEF